MPPDEDKPKPEPPTLGEKIFAVAAAVARLEPGPLARLRRMKADGPGTAEFWKLALDHDLRTDSAGLRFVALLAQLTPKGEPGGKQLHDRRVPFGQALGAKGYPETRLLRFLATPFDKRPDGLQAMVGWLVSKGHEGVNCVDLANMLWVEDDERRVQHDRHLARHYFAEQKKRSEKKDKAA